VNIGYARVSTDDQKSALQTDALKAAGCERIFEDIASGAKSARPGLEQAIDFMRTGDTLVVWKLDRLARSMRQLIDTVELLQSKGIGFRSLTESIDTTTAGGMLVFHIFGALAEFERAIIRERTRAGLDAARARGRKGGRPKQMTAKKIAMARGMLADPTITMNDVARELGVSIATLYRYVPGGRAAIEDGAL
jgi:DNA invertase Pin-like site-specific DNA recombinase